MLHVLGIACLLLYLSASYAFVVAVFWKHGKETFWPLRLLKLGFLFHTLVLLLLLIGDTPFALRDRGDYFLWLSWLLPLVYFLFKAKLGSPMVGAFVAPVALLLFTGSSLLLHFRPKTHTDGMDYFFLSLHVLPALIAELSLVVAFIVSMLFLIQHRRLKRKSMEALRVRGPNLELLISLNHHAVLVGFLAMTVAIISGVMRAFTVSDFVLSGDFLTWLSLITWLVLGVILSFRLKAHWSAHKQSLATAWVAGLFFALVTISIVTSGGLIHGGFHS